MSSQFTNRRPGSRCSPGSSPSRLRYLRQADGGSERPERRSPGPRPPREYVRGAGLGPNPHLWPPRLFLPSKLQRDCTSRRFLAGQAGNHWLHRLAIPGCEPGVTSLATRSSVVAPDSTPLSGPRTGIAVPDPRPPGSGAPRRRAVREAHPGDPGWREWLRGAGSMSSAEGQPQASLGTGSHRDGSVRRPAVSPRAERGG